MVSHCPSSCSLNGWHWRFNPDQPTQFVADGAHLLEWLAPVRVRQQVEHLVQVVLVDVGLVAVQDQRLVEFGGRGLAHVHQRQSEEHGHLREDLNHERLDLDQLTEHVHRGRHLVHLLVAPDLQVDQPEHLVAERRLIVTADQRVHAARPDQDVDEVEHGPRDAVVAQMRLKHAQNLKGHPFHMLWLRLHEVAQRTRRVFDLRSRMRRNGQLFDGFELDLELVFVHVKYYQKPT